jgi:60 kDa SS-A/Ro ribonucleoprotein
MSFSKKIFGNQTPTTVQSKGCTCPKCQGKANTRSQGSSRVTRLEREVQPDTCTMEGRNAFEKPLRDQVVQALMTATVNGAFYAEQKCLVAGVDKIFEKAAREDPEFFAKACVYAREEGLIRLYPVVGLAYLQKYAKPWFHRAFSKVVKIPSDLLDFATVLKSLGGKVGCSSVSKEVRKFMNNLSEYHVLKYGGKERGRGFNLRDMLLLSHPTPKDAKQDAIFGYMIRDKVPLKKDCPQIFAFNKLKQARTCEEAIKQIEDGKLPFEIAFGSLSFKPGDDLWSAVVDQMPVFALLRNLNNLDKHGLIKAKKELLKQRFDDAESVRKSRIMPFEFYKAWENIKDESLKKMVAKALEHSMESLDKVYGKTSVQIDQSGSMGTDLRRVAMIFGYMIAKRSTKGSLVHAFNTGCEEIEDIGDSLPKFVENYRGLLNGGTDTGCVVQDLLRKNLKVDNIVIFTDEQQNSGSSFYRVIRQYRSQVNPEVKVVIVDVSAYAKSGGMVPDSMPNSTYVYGWSGVVPQLVAGFSRGQKDVEENIVKVEI